jgi:uncharacterized protein (DUF952 family)
VSDRICHVLHAHEWSAAQAAGDWRPPSLTDPAQGFVHLSTPEQVEVSASTYYRGATDLVLLTVDTERLGEGLVWEESTPPPGAPVRPGLFPHLYGPLPVGAVTAAHPWPPEPDGSFRLPK